MEVQTLTSTVINTPQLFLDLKGGVSLQVKTLTGRTFTIQADLYGTVQDLMDIIEKQSGILSHNQRLIHQGKTLESSHLLSDYLLENGSVIHMVVRLRGA